MNLTECINDFSYFCNNACKVEDKNTHTMKPFELYSCQVDIARRLQNREWLWILKARRLGLTWLLAAYAVWLAALQKKRDIAVLNQNKEYAQDFLDRVRAIIDELPAELRPKVCKNSKSRLNFGTGSSIRSFAATKRALRSLAADLVIFDEAAYIDLLHEARGAAQPAVEIGGGQIVGLSTSAGPSGEFYDVWNSCRGATTRYTPIFLNWRAHPQRGEEWYQREAAANSADALYMKREYPNSPEEAFESASGRIYPLFSAYGESGELFIRTVDPRHFHRCYRAIDFGGVDPFVCLWGATIRDRPPMLTIDPSCQNLIRELLAYSRDKNGQPQDRNNHACDALRYMVVTGGSNGITGHLHIYREMYMVNTAALGTSMLDLAELIETKTGDERPELTICDRSRPDSMALLETLRVRPVCGQRIATGGRLGEIEQGIVRVNELIVGTTRGEKRTIRSRHACHPGLSLFS